MKSRDGESEPTWWMETKKRSSEDGDGLRYVSFGVEMRHPHGDVYSLLATVYV